MVVLVCWNCGQEIEVRFLDEIINCPKCGETISREIPKYVQKGTGRKRKMRKENLDKK